MPFAGSAPGWPTNDCAANKIAPNPESPDTESSSPARAEKDLLYAELAHFPGGKSQQGLPIGPVASVFVSRWDGAVASKVTAESKNKLGIAIAQRTYKAGIDIDAFAAQLWGEAARSFVKSWNDLMSVIASKIKTIKPEK